MRGDHDEPEPVFSYITPSQRVPKDHPLRAIRTMVDDVLRRLRSDFDGQEAKLYFMGHVVMENRNGWRWVRG
jgi:hypothetical protein